MRIRAIAIQFVGVFTLGWLLGMVVIATPGKAAPPKRQTMARSRSQGVYEPPLHPLLVATFQVLAALTAWSTFDRSTRKADAG